jgi:hypothetical protein
MWRLCHVGRLFVLRLFPYSPYAKEHSTEAPKNPPPKISAVEKAAVRIMRKLYEATGGNPLRWESLDNLGAVKADAASLRGEPHPGRVCASGLGRYVPDKKRSTGCLARRDGRAFWVTSAARA